MYLQFVDQEFSVEYNSNMYEHLYIAIVKIGYCMRRKNFLDYTVKCNWKLEALRNNVVEIGCYSHLVGKNAIVDKVCLKFFGKEY